MFGARKRNRSWALEIAVGILMRPQQLLLRWFAGPRLLEVAAGLRAFTTPRVGIPPSNRFKAGPPSDSMAASIQDLRTAVSADWLWVPLKKIRSHRAQIFSAEQHPYVRYFRDGLGGMEKFFTLDTPVTPRGYLFMTEARQVLVNRSIDLSSARVWPWASLTVTLPEPPTFPYWRAGPKTKSHMLAQAERLDGILRSVRRKGYIVKHGDIPWYSLLLKDHREKILDYRVLVQHGNHRVATLAHLGWELIPMAPLPTMLINEVRLSEIERWPGVLDGTFSISEAEARFMAFFRDIEEDILPGLDLEAR